MTGIPLVCIPVNRDDLVRALTTGLPGPLVGFAATPALIDTFDLEPDAEESAEYAAALIASVVALSTWGERLVISAQVPIKNGSLDDELEANGGVEISELPASAIVAWFSDLSVTEAAVAAKAAAKLSIDDAWAQPAVVELLRDHDLIWHDLSELPD